MQAQHNLSLTFLYEYTAVTDFGAIVYCQYLDLLSNILSCIIVNNIVLVHIVPKDWTYVTITNRIFDIHIHWCKYIVWDYKYVY